MGTTRPPWSTTFGSMMSLFAIGMLNEALVMWWMKLPGISRADRLPRTLMMNSTILLVLLLVVMLGTVVTSRVPWLSSIRGVAALSMETCTCPLFSLHLPSLTCSRVLLLKVEILDPVANTLAVNDGTVTLRLWVSPLVI